MAKKTLNQNAKYVQDLIESVEPDYIFSSKPLNRFKVFEENDNDNKKEKLSNLKEKILYPMIKDVQLISRLKVLIKWPSKGIIIKLLTQLIFQILKQTNTLTEFL